MNMNKALQNLYHAVSGSTTTKVNISKLLVDIHQAITGKESSNKNNWSRIINSMADNWPEGGGGGGDFSTATVTIVNSTAESLDISLLPTYAVEEGMGYTICTLGDQLSSNTSVTIPIVLYKGGCIWATYSVDAYADYTFTGTGSVSMDLGIPFITGDCTITIS